MHQMDIAQIKFRKKTHLMPKHQLIYHIINSIIFQEPCKWGSQIIHAFFLVNFEV